MTGGVDPSRQFGTLTQPPHLGVWRTLVVVALVAANVMIVLSHGTPVCSAAARPGIFIGWIAAPALAIAAIATIAATASERSERLAASALAPLLTIGWIAALIWVSPGIAIDAVGC